MLMTRTLKDFDGMLLTLQEFDILMHEFSYPDYIDLGYSLKYYNYHHLLFTDQDEEIEIYVK